MDRLGRLGDLHQLAGGGVGISEVARRVRHFMIRLPARFAI